MLLAALLIAAAPIAAQPAAAPVAKFNHDTPVQDIAADAKAKAVLDADMPTLTTNPAYETFKGMSLHQLQPYSDKLTDALLTKVAADLATVK